MSSAARDPLGADALPALAVSQARVSEAAPDPPPGPDRAALAEHGAARVDRAVALMEQAVSGYTDRLAGVVAARMRSPKSRKGTRWWSDRVKSAQERGVNGPVALTSREQAGGATTTTVETKALDVDHILPERTVTEIADVVRPVGLRIAAEAAGDTAKQLGRPNVGLAAFDQRAIDSAIESVVARMLETNRRHAADIRREITGADATAESLDEAIDRVMEATKRGGRWLLINGRTLATALAGDAALAAASALGCTHTQWISRRDDRVRASHVRADGQVRAVGAAFQVGLFRLRFPGDPLVLPAGAQEVHGCRCFLAPIPPDRMHTKVVTAARAGTPGAARELTRRGNRRRATPGGLEAGGDTPPDTTTPSTVVGYRRLDDPLDVDPGQRVSWPEPLQLALAPSPVPDQLMLAVTIPAGVAVTAAGGTVTLPAGAALEVAEVIEGRVTAAPVAA